MAYTTLELITDAYYLSGIVERFSTVSGEQVADGLKRLNSFIAVKSMDLGMIPYYTKYDFPTVYSQQDYFIEKLLQPDILTFTWQDVRYSLRPVQRDQFWGMPRANNINSLPYQWSYERKHNGCDIYLYFHPADVYDMQLWGKFALSSVALTQDLSESLDEFYIEYMRYGLAIYVSQLNNIVPSLDLKETFKSYELQLRNISAPDLTMRKTSYFNHTNNINYGIVVLSNGWIPN